MLHIKRDDRDNTKEQCHCISILIPLRTEWLSKKSENKMKDIIGISIIYWRVHLR